MEWIVGDHDDHRLTHMAHSIAGEDGVAIGGAPALGHKRRDRARQLRKIRVCPHGEHTLGATRLRAIDREDAGVSVRASDEAEAKCAG
jgi:hypothetical protein